jgi:hypothetical protein
MVVDQVLLVEGVEGEVPALLLEMAEEKRLGMGSGLLMGVLGVLGVGERARGVRHGRSMERRRVPGEGADGESREVVMVGTCGRLEADGDGTVLYCLSK